MFLAYQSWAKGQRVGKTNSQLGEAKCESVKEKAEAV